LALTLSAAFLRARAGLDSGHDAGLLEVRDAWQPALQRGIGAPWLASSDPGVQAALTLGMAEVIAGEYLAQLLRAPGSLDSVRLFGLAVDPPRLDPRDPSGLKAQGLARLSEFAGISASSGGVMTSPAPVEPLK
jgi:hypothetical protein